MSALIQPDCIDLALVYEIMEDIKLLCNGVGNALDMKFIDIDATGVR